MQGASCMGLFRDGWSLVDDGTGEAAYPRFLGPSCHIIPPVATAPYPAVLRVSAPPPHVE
jgi:hypothetical protein